MELDNIYAILIEVTFFGGLGLLYYIFQKRKILKRDLQNIFGDLYELFEGLPADIKNESHNNFIEELKTMIEKQNLTQIIQLLDKQKDSYPQDVAAKIEECIRGISYHQNSAK